MTDLNKLLNDADPIRDDRGLSRADAEQMRRVMLSAALESAPERTPWLRPLAVAAVGAVLVVVGTLAGHRVADRPSPAATPDPATTALGGNTGNDRRQLQFATPGGTRIIWIFDQNLRLQESMP